MKDYFFGSSLTQSSSKKKTVRERQQTEGISNQALGMGGGFSVFCPQRSPSNQPLMSLVEVSQAAGLGERRREEIIQQQAGF